MNRRTIITLSASVIVIAAGLALAQPEGTPARRSVQTAERLTQMRASLVGAIIAAERHTQGTAVGARVSMNWAEFQHDSTVRRESDGRAEQQAARERIERDIRQQSPNLSREQMTSKVNEQMQREARERTRQRGAQGASINPALVEVPGGLDGTDGSLIAVVTCVMDHARVRDILVDMSDNSIIGSYAADAFGDAAGRTPSERDRTRDGQMPSAANVRASDLMNASAHDSAGNRLGDIDELVIDPQSNRVIYAVLRRGGFLGIGESRFAIATSELSIPYDGRMHLSLSESDFDGQSGFDSNSWPMRGDARWSRNAPQDTAAATAALRIVKATDIIGSEVECRDGNDLGEIKDLIVEPRSGRVVYAIVDSKNGYLPVPMESLSVRGDGYLMPMTMEEIRARPTIAANRDPNWNDTAWNRSVYQSYGLTLDERQPDGQQPGDRRNDNR